MLNGRLILLTLRAITAFLSLILGIFIFYKNRKSYVNIFFSGFYFSVFLWLFATVLSHISTDIVHINFLHHIAYTGVISLHLGFYHFPILYLKKDKWYKSLYVVYLLGSIFIILLFFTDYFLSGVYKYTWGYYPKAAILHPLYIGFSIFIYTTVFVLTYIKLTRNHLTKLESKRTKYLLLGILICCFAAIDYLPNYGISIYPIGFIFVFTFIGITTYAILRHQLLDITVVIKKTFSYTLILLLLILPCFIVVILTERFLPQSLYYPIMGCLFILVGLIYPKLRIHTEQTLENILFRKLFDYKKTLANLSKKMANLQNIDELLSNTTETIAKAIDTSYLAFYLLNNENHQYELKSFYGKYKKRDNKIDQGSNLIQYMESTDEIISSDNVNINNTIQKELKEIDAYICIPIKFEHKLKAFMVIAEKESVGGYLQEELGILSTMANQLAVAIENSLKYKEITELNLNLEKKVEEKTKELKEAQLQLLHNEKLASLGQLAAGVAHEIRNPAVAVSNCFEVLGKRIAKIKDNKITFNEAYPDLDKFIKQGETSLKRIQNIVRSLLGFSCKNNEGLNHVDIHQGIDDTLIMLEYQIKNGIQIHKEYGDIGKIKADLQQLNQVFMNICNNAIYAIEAKRKKKIDCGNIWIKTFRNGEYIIIEIKDDGIGIPANVQNKIFEPFFTTKDVGEGTGLGLHICYKIIKEHQGHIEIKSKENEGTTIAIKLPKNIKE